MDEHLNANRVWGLIRDNETFAMDESSHMSGCIHCIEWVTNFADMARKAGFKIAFEIPPRPKAATNQK